MRVDVLEIQSEDFGVVPHANVVHEPRFERAVEKSRFLGRNNHKRLLPPPLGAVVVAVSSIVFSLSVFTAISGSVVALSAGAEPFAPSFSTRSLSAGPIFSVWISLFSFGWGSIVVDLRAFPLSALMLV